MSEVSIINKALSYLGANRITSLSDKTLEAESASNLYDDSLRSVLAECDWRFAIKRARLNKVEKTPVWGEGNYFQLPSDFIELFGVNNNNPFVKWALEEGLIWSDAAVLDIRYVYFCKNTTMYPPYFIDAFACKLASDMCYELTNSNDKTMALLELYKGEYLPIARTKNAREASKEVMKDGYWVNSVLGGIYG